MIFILLVRFIKIFSILFIIKDKIYSISFILAIKKLLFIVQKKFILINTKIYKLLKEKYM